MPDLNKQNVANITSIFCLVNKVIEKVSNGEINVDDEQVKRVTANKVIDTLGK
jgi:hypothetical protein